MRRNFLRRVKRGALLFTAALASGIVTSQQTDFSKVEVRAEQVAPSLYVLFGAGGNIGVLIGDDGTVIIDDQFSQMAPKIGAAIALLTDKPVRFVINTHWHGDHTGSNEAFGRGGSVIIAQENTRKRLSTRQFVDFFKMESAPAAPAGLPIVTFTESVDLHLDGEDIAVVHVPNAHTDSDAVLYFRHANVVHTGDVYTNTGYPFIDTGTGGSIDGMIAAGAQILARIDEQTKVIPGHGPLAKKADVQSRQAMLVTVRERIAALLRKHKTLQQAIAAKPTAEFDASYFKAGPFTPDVWVQSVYLDLARSLARTSTRSPVKSAKG